ncbi:MAG: Ig-like domain-containing protein [candidate division Zixibacteria bacterium]|nr:Ig-like domain-containing protein [candidate division Zixibacteria bacterium]
MNYCLPRIVRTRTWLFSLLLLTLACAEVAPPPGGDIDKTKPFLVSSIPGNGAVNVTPDNSIKLYFSELITGPKRDKAIFISPRPATEPKTKWKSDYVEIILPEDFQQNQTYVVSLGSRIKDLRGNELDGSPTIAFSTGSLIDSGHVAGQIKADNQRPGSGLMVTLYDLSRTKEGVPFDSLYGDYLTQSNQRGYFSFRYLPGKEYRLIAYDDKNRNEQFNPGSEPFAVPDRKILVGGSIPLDSLTLTLETKDTTSPEILSVSHTVDNFVRIRLSREISLTYLSNNLSGLILRPSDDSTTILMATAMLEVGQDQASTLNFFIGPLIEGAYLVELTYDTTQSPVSYSELIVTAQEDKTAPQVVLFEPDDKPLLVDEIRITTLFSEPLDTTYLTSETFVLWEKPDKRVPMSWSWSDPLHLLFHPDTVESGASYSLEMTEFEIVDNVGNRLGDSLREYSFSVLNEDSLGWISGTVEITVPGKESDPVLLTLTGIGTQRTVDVSVNKRAFITKIPAGRYLLSGFVDSDGDGKHGNGSVEPFYLAETSAKLSDTIAVRPRFETTGIEFIFR